MNFIIVDPCVGQYTLTYEDPSLVTFLIIKRDILARTWDDVKLSNRTYFPVMSRSQDEKDIDAQIEEDKNLEFYHYENGGIIFMHYLFLEEIMNFPTEINY